MTDQLIRDFATLFEGRTDAYGMEWGGCERPQFHGADPHAYWLERVRAHLAGEPVGVYPMVPQHPWGHPEWGLDGWDVKWGCVDLDVKAPGKRRWDYETEADAHVAAGNLVAALRALGITGWIERTRSYGRHVWAFASGWTPAADMRRTLLVACKLADVPPTEVNPKSERFESPQSLGNYVRLPYPGPLDQRLPTRVVLHNDLMLSLETFLTLAMEKRSAPHVFAAAAQLWQKPTHKHGGVDLVFDVDVELPNPLPGYVYTLAKQGPKSPDEDRSGWLYRLACKCEQAGLDESTALAVVTYADVQHTRKYVTRSDGEKRLIETVERAYA